MWQKVAWLFVWMTLAFWAGCGGDGEDQNYRINQDRTPIFQEGYPTQPGPSSYLLDPSDRTSTTAAAQPALGATDAVGPQPVPPVTGQKVGSPLGATDAAEAPLADERSVTTISRQHWPAVTIAPLGGVVYHQTRYFAYSDWRLLDVTNYPIDPDTWEGWHGDKPTIMRLRPDRPSPLYPPTVELTPETLHARPLNALRGASNPYETVELVDLFLAPAKFAFDVGTWPARMVIEPPFNIQQSPQD